ncbi:MAG: hypothetical protein ABGX04_02600 [Myxococcales bacterium]|nr:hypothetical protein [Myxococcales bacterium]
MMWTVVGLTCVAWTSLELVRPWNASRVAIALDCERPHAKARLAMNRQRFAAWDESGRMIVVEDLGHH